MPDSEVTKATLRFAAAAGLNGTATARTANAANFTSDFHMAPLHELECLATSLSPRPLNPGIGRASLLP